MKKLLLSILTISTFAAFAQKDLGVTLTTPANGYAITSAIQFNLTGTVMNYGATAIATTDTFIVVFTVNGNTLKNTSGNAIGQSFTGVSLPTGASVPFAINGLSFGTISTFTGATFCAIVFLESGGVLGDANAANDQSCHNVTFSVNAGLNDVTSAAQSLKVYPNPAKDVINFSIEGNVAKTISIMDITGRNIEVVNMTSNDTQININNYNNGIYLYQIKSEGGQVIKSGKFNVSK